MEELGDPVIPREGVESLAENFGNKVVQIEMV